MGKTGRVTLLKKEYNTSMRKHYFFLLILILINTVIKAEETKNFKPYGEPTAKVYFDYHQGFGKDKETYSNNDGFRITRTYFGYKYYFSPNWSMKIVLDADDPNAGKLTEVAYVKNAQLNFKDDKISASFGIISLSMFNEQESNWGYRYIYKSAMDEYKFGNSADAGVFLSYDFLDNLSADATLTNGEGYKQQQDIEGNYRMGYGITFKPVKGLTLRGFYDQFFSPSSTVGAIRDDQKVFSGFAGYCYNSFRIGAEYDYLENYQFDRIDDRYIVSAYSSYKFFKKINLFARYDYMNAKKVWSTEDVILFGLEYSPVKGVKISPNYKSINYKNSNSPDGSFFSVNFEYKY